jgi:hypothetical protein
MTHIGRKMAVKLSKPLIFHKMTHDANDALSMVV